ncbi:MAG TPA: MEDS domain-containing protein [Candidatus Dormibacteraeota bacterium]|nr:MEDS domain-containing protein [Candidatus Dormibacteraeota bacterium]
MAGNGRAPGGFRHQALLYAGADDFVAQTLPIIAGAVAAGEPVLVAVDQTKIELLRRRLGEGSRAVGWTDIRGIGGNPARIIPMWRQFVAQHGDRGRVLGFGEPIWPGRSPAALAEAQRHEELLNLAFEHAPGFTLLCPYDTESLDGRVLDQTQRSHPTLFDQSGAHASPSCLGLDAIAAWSAPPLGAPAGETRELTLAGAGAEAVGRLLADPAVAGALEGARRADLTTAIAALVGFMGRAPGARPLLRVWQDVSAVVVEISGLGPVRDPLAGREWPAPPAGPERGLWLANQLCDLVQLRSSRGEAVVRLHVSP